MDRINVEVVSPGAVNAAVSIMPEYNGEYTVVPRIGQETVLPTAKHLMTSNVTVGEIPVTELPNEAGGITLAVGGQTDE